MRDAVRQRNLLQGNDSASKIINLFDSKTQMSIETELIRSFLFGLITIELI